jgi:hypothetical protein
LGIYFAVKEVKPDQWLVGLKMEGELKERSVCSKAKRQATLGEEMATGLAKSVDFLINF